MSRADTIEQRPLGRSGVQLTTLGFGAWEIGGGTTWGKVDADAAASALARAVDLGVNWVDTAHVYGGGGGSEAIVGQVLADHPDVQVSTKLAPEPDDAYTAAGMRRELQAGLQRLGRDHVDVYLLHWPSDVVPLAETWGAMNDLKAEGLVRAIGLSNYGSADVTLCRSVAPVDVLQMPMSLLDLDTYDDQVDSATQYGTGIVTYGTLAYGLLAERQRRHYDDWRGGAVARDDFFVDENYLRFFAPEARTGIDQRLEALSTAATEGDVQLVDAALQWVVAQRGVTGALVGTTNADHVARNVAAVTEPLRAHTAAALSAAARA
ncbi:aldo/keto reductase [Curtobacterium sp. 9128]|uniref:aldo/keto reductase n=1 Tax=Curtobacterium sp. 9128 TaxID=1793722 RepID=UPI0016436394|nr:aldo/keto reductase [Curtobacterium sp. 9128]